MKTKKSFLQEFRSMLFDYKIIYIFLAYVVISLLTNFVVGYVPIKETTKIGIGFNEDTNTANDLIDYTDKFEEIKEEYYEMKLKDILEDSNQKVLELRGYSDSDYTEINRNYLELISQRMTLIMQGYSLDSPELTELGAKIDEASRKKDDLWNKIDLEKQFSREKKDEIFMRVNLLPDRVIRQTEVNKTDTFHDLRNEGLLLGIGYYFGKNTHLIAWVNALILEIFLGVISYLYIRKRKNNSVENGSIEAYKEDKRNILLSFITISLIMLLFMYISRFIIVNMKYPGKFSNVNLSVFGISSITKNTFYPQLVRTFIFSIVYYISRPILYSKRAELINVKTSSIYFLIFNGIMYFIYFNLPMIVFVSLTGPLAFTPSYIFAIPMLILFIMITIYSYKSFMSGEELFKRRKAEKLTENKENNN